MINTEILNNLSETELIKIQQNISYILYRKEQKVEDIFKNFDLEGLKSFINEHPIDIENFLYHHAERVHFIKMKYDDIKFFLYVREIPKFKNIDEEYSSMRYYGKTAEAIIASLKDKRLFDFFIKNVDFSHLIKDVVERFYLKEEISLDVMHELFKNKIIEPTEKLLKEILTAIVNKTESSKYAFNFVKYFIKNDIYKFSQEQYVLMYLDIWQVMDDDFFELFKSKSRAYKKITLTNLINKTFPEYDNYRHYNYQTLVKYNDFLFYRIIENHKLSKKSINSLIKAFEYHYPDLTNRFHKFVEIIISKFPEHIDKFKQYNKDSIENGFKSEYNKAINYIDIILELKETDGKGKINKTKTKI